MWIWNRLLGTGFSNGGLLAHFLARHPDTSELIKALLPIGGVVPEGYRRLIGLKGAGQETFHCFAKDATDRICQNLAICLWVGGERSDNRVSLGVGATHERFGRTWIGDVDPSTGGIEPMDIMHPFF